MKWSCWLATAVVIIVIVVSYSHSASAYVMPSGSLACFSRPKGGDTKVCEKIHGFRTCYTRYNTKGKVTGRGCSTQKPNFKTCDTHKYGKKKSEKYCYCTEDFCNTSPVVAPNTTLLALLVIAQCSNSVYLIVVQLLAVLLHTCRHCHLIFCSLLCQIARFLTCQITSLLTCQSQHFRSGDRNLNEHVTKYERNCSPNFKSDHSYHVKFYDNYLVKFVPQDRSPFMNCGMRTGQRKLNLDISYHRKTDQRHRLMITCNSYLSNRVKTGLRDPCHQVKNDQRTDHHVKTKQSKDLSHQEKANNKDIRHHLKAAHKDLSHPVKSDYRNFSYQLNTVQRDPGHYMKSYSNDLKRHMKTINRDLRHYVKTVHKDLTHYFKPDHRESYHHVKNKRIDLSCRVKMDGRDLRTREVVVHVS
eukprot:TRINITY_DN67151_c0_g1_i1.p1 TRINITY_DN67151_c0_g1~~TRINITY_DN67151_c0_g1_i1.p1  ORF type:complete len:414 (-),score=41.75 TRINITY_DN67151_c0_g1_i1:103-1344(-)